MDAADALLKEVEPAEGRKTKPSKHELVNECQNFLQAEFGGGDASHTTQTIAPGTEGNILSTSRERQYVDVNLINYYLK